MASFRQTLALAVIVGLLFAAASPAAAYISNCDRTPAGNEAVLESLSAAVLV